MQHEGPKTRLELEGCQPLPCALCDGLWYRPRSFLVHQKTEWTHAETVRVAHAGEPV